MSNNDEKKTHKPTPMSGKVPLRTVSAQPTLYESSSTTGTSTEKTDLKLNINATVFVPKEKRADPPKSEKENSVNTGTVTGTTTGGGFTPQSTIPLTAYPTPTGQFTGQYPKSSMMSYTYLNNQIPQTMQNMYNPMQGGFGYSPNTRGPTGQFFPNQYPSTIPMNNPMGYQYQPSTYKVPSIQGYQMPTNTQIPTISVPTQPTTNSTPTTTTTTSGNTSEKKILFNKDAAVFVPKGLRDRTKETGDRKVSESVGDRKEEHAQEKEPEENRNEITTDFKKEQTPQEKTEETIENKIQIEDKKPKLKDLFNSGPVKHTPATGPKEAPAKAVATKVVVASTTKAKPTNDIQKSLEEKRKLLMTKQKEEKSKAPVSQQFRKPEKVMEREPPKKDDSYDETPIPSDSEESDEQPSKKNLKLERFYFLVDETKPQEKVKHVYNIDYLLSFSKWKICNEDRLLDDMLKGHIEAMKIYEDERPKGYKGKEMKKPISGGEGKFTINRGANAFEDKEKEKMSFVRSSLVKNEPQLITTAGDGQTLGKWGRKDMSEAERLAKEFKEKFEEERKKDPIRNELTELLNILTVDNYEEVKMNILKKIQGNEEDQYKFLDVLFKKAVSEKAFVSLYARVCKDLDRDMPQKTEKDVRVSKMRSKLIDKCREIFKAEGNTKIEHINKITDPDEKEMKLKKFLLGNVNFIGELINAKLLSRKIVFQCIDNLLVRIEKAESADIKLVKQTNLEAIVILIDKFGTLINKHDPKMKGTNDLNEFNEKIDNYLLKLDRMQDKDDSIPGHIRYKIINLIEKRNRGWEESKVDKTSTAKGIREVREEYENEQRAPTNKGVAKLDQDAVNAKIKEDLYAWRDHLKNDYKPEDYNWEITEALTRKYKNNLADILTAFGETCIDFVLKKDDIHYAYTYMRELITYYGSKQRAASTEILEVTLFFLQNLSDFMLDNTLLSDVWGGVIYLLEYYKFFTFTDLEKLKDVQEDQLKAIFEVVNNSLSYYDDREEKIKELNNITLVKANKALFQSIVSSE